MLVRFPSVADLDSDETVMLSPDGKEFALDGGNVTDRYLALAAADGKWVKILNPHFLRFRHEGENPDDRYALTWSPDNQFFFYRYLVDSQPTMDVMTADGRLLKTIPFTSTVDEDGQPCR